MTERTCVCCNKTREKDEMIRISSELEPDFRGRACGRGFYVCPDIKCISKLDSGRTSIRRSLQVKTVDKNKLLALKMKLTDAMDSRAYLVRMMNVQD